MTQVDFYILTQPGASARNQLVCKVADKAFRSGHRVYVYAGDPQQVQEIDQLLWTFSQGSFAPHEAYTGTLRNGHTPILIGDREAPDNWHDVLISLVDEVPDFFSRFDRVIEVVDGDEHRKKNARKRFRFYRDRGYALQSHQV
jgi:DNA polymerase-3 subunit chi